MDTSGLTLSKHKSAASVESDRITPNNRSSILFLNLSLSKQPGKKNRQRAALIHDAHNLFEVIRFVMTTAALLCFFKIPPTEFCIRYIFYKMNAS